MKTRTLVTSVAVIGSMAVGAILARSVTVHHNDDNVSYSANVAVSTAPADQPTGGDVYACVSSDGKLDYLEFRSPTPHKCWKSDETLWDIAAAPDVSATPTPTVTATPTTTVSATPTVSVSATATESTAG